MIEKTFGSDCDGQDYYEVRDIDPILGWLKKNAEDAHTYDCGWRYITVDMEAKNPHERAKHEPCTCGLQKILDKIE